MFKRILIIDDDENFCKIVKMNLELRVEAEKKFNVITATDGNAGIKQAKQFRPDLILLDIMMPKTDGFKVLEALKKDKSTMTIPVVMLTGRDDDEAKAETLKLYNEAYLTKPIDAKGLREKIEEIFKVRGI